MLRKIGIGFIALATLSPGLVAALGVGEYQLNSYLNEPLDMTVELQDLGDLSEDEIIAELASQEDFDNAGVERDYFLSDLEFDVTLNGDRGEVRIRSEEPVREPYLNFLVEYLWPTGRLMREYTVLLDPPSYDDDAESVAPARSEQPPRPVSEAEPERSDADSRQRDTAQAERPAPAPERPPEEPEQPEPQPESQPEQEAESEPAPADQEGGRYQVKASDTLWGIADRERPARDVSVQQMMLAIQESNEDAFIDRNLNLVREGAVLRLPSEAQARRINNRDALARVEQQNQAWQERRGRQAARDTQEAPLDATGRDRQEADGGDGQGSVTLLNPETSDDAGDGDATGTTPDGDADTATLQNELALRDENLDRLDRDNEELRSRLQDLDEQAETSRRLLELRNEQIAALQQQLRRLQEEEGLEIDPELLEEPDSPATAPDDQSSDSASDDDQRIDDDSAEDSGAIDETTDDDTADDETAAADASTDEDAADDTAEDSAEDDRAADVSAINDDDQADDGAEPAEPAAPFFPDGLINLLRDNLLYLGALLAIILLLILLVLRRRGGDQDEPPEDDDHFGDDFDDGLFTDGDRETGTGGALDGGMDNQAGSDLESDLDDDQMDAMERADVYVAYGQYPQAVDYLRNEINQAPERGDLKIRLLELLREMDDDQGFQQQAALFAGSSAAVDTAIRRLGGDPGEHDYSATTDNTAVAGTAASGTENEDVSLDDLELDLASDLSDQPEPEPEPEPEAEARPEQEEDVQELELEDFDFKLDDEEDIPERIQDDEEQDGALDQEESLELDDLVIGEPESRDDQQEALEFTLDDDELSTEDDTPALQLDDDELSALDEIGDGADRDVNALEDDDDLNDLTFEGDAFDEDRPLNEGAPNESVPNEESALNESTPDEDGLDDLDLGDLDDLDDLQDQAEDGGEAPAPEPEQVDDDRPAVPATAVPEGGDDMLGDDDDFDFLGETDENATKLDLARAYIDMGDADGARDILNEVLGEGTEEQQNEAKELLARVG